jgi:hypothetical protein
MDEANRTDAVRSLHRLYIECRRLSEAAAIAATELATRIEAIPDGDLGTVVAWDPSARTTGAYLLELALAAVACTDRNREEACGALGRATAALIRRPAFGAPAPGEGVTRVAERDEGEGAA